MSPYVFWFPWFDVRYDFLIKTIFVSFACSCLYDGSCLIYVVCVCLYDGSCLIYVVCMMAHVLFTLFVWWLMSYLRCLCLFAYIGVQHILCCVFLRIVWPVLPVSLDCPFLIAPSVFSNVYQHWYLLWVITIPTHMTIENVSQSLMLRV